MSSSDSGVENSNDPPRLKEAVKTFLSKREKMIAELLGVRPLGVAHGKQGIPARALRLRQHPRGHLIDRVFLYLPAALRAERAAHPRKQQAQEVVAFGRSGHGRSRIAAGVLLANRNGRRNTVDLVDVRFLHPLQELPRIRRKRFHVAPLAFCVDRVESQRRLPRTRDTCDDRQPVVRDRQRNVF